MSEQRPLYGIWLKTFRGWLCDHLGVGYPYYTYSLGRAVTRLLTAKTSLDIESVMSPVSGDVFLIADVCDRAKETMVVRSFSEWAKSEGLIE